MGWSSCVGGCQRKGCTISRNPSRANGATTLASLLAADLQPLLPDPALRARLRSRILERCGEMPAMQVTRADEGAWHRLLPGIKVKLLGDAVYEQDSALPQLSLGVQHKRNNRGDLVRAIGAQDDSGTDVYLSATKLLLNYSLLLNGTLRYTEANQFGILGFGGDRRDGHRLQYEGSAAVLLSRKIALGAEYRSKPDNRNIADEDSARDAFVAWAPNKQVALTLAYVDLGNIVIADNQRGWSASLQVGF